MPFVEVELAGVLPLPEQEKEQQNAKVGQAKNPLFKATSAMNKPTPYDVNFNCEHLVIRGLMPLDAKAKIAMNVRAVDKSKSTLGRVIGARQNTLANG
eukprot:8905454-Pyramimonas_sp.AAC.1